MSKKKRKPIEFEDVDCVRKTMAWHADQICLLHKKLEPHKTTRGTIAGIYEKESVVFMIFKASVEEMFKVTEFIEGLDAQ